jgi:hypothetical protein
MKKVLILMIGILILGLSLKAHAVLFGENLNLFPVQEPANMMLLGIGLIGFGVVGRRKFFKKD